MLPLWKLRSEVPVFSTVASRTRAPNSRRLSSLATSLGLETAMARVSPCRVAATTGEAKARDTYKRSAYFLFFTACICKHTRAARKRRCGSWGGAWWRSSMRVRARSCLQRTDRWGGSTTPCSPPARPCLSLHCCTLQASGQPPLGHPLSWYARAGCFRNFGCIDGTQSEQRIATGTAHL